MDIARIQSPALQSWRREPLYWRPEAKVLLYGIRNSHTHGKKDKEKMKDVPDICPDQPDTKALPDIWIFATQI